MRSVSIAALVAATLALPALCGLPSASSLRLLFKNGDRITGALSQDKIEVATANGVVHVNASDISRVAYGHPRHRRDTIVLKNGDRVSGVIGASTFAFTTASGQTLDVNKSTLAGLEAAR